MKAHPPHRIAIVGAGVGGLASALYLHRLGHDVHVIEQFDAPRALGSGLLLQPTGLTVLHDLGLADHILLLGRRIGRLTGTDARSGRTVLDVAYREPRFGLAVHRAALFDLLHDAVRRAGIPVVTATRVTRILDAPDGVTLESQADSAGRFDLAVDAAGAKSPLRDGRAAGGTTRPLAYGALWSSLVFPDRGFDPHALQQRYQRASIMIGVLPTGRQTTAGPHQCAFFWSIRTDAVEALRDAGLGAWKAHVRDLWPATAPLLDQIGSFDDMTLARYGHHTMRTPYRGRLIHIGDSAHATSPQLGQGANMALLDAAALAHAVATSRAVEDIGPTYAAMRRRHVRVFQALSLLLTPFYQSDSIVVPFARDTLVATLSKMPPVPALLASLVSGTLVDPFRRIGLSEVQHVLPLQPHAVRAK